MCCCDVTTCCCGQHSLQKGTFIWAIVDAVLNLVFFVITVLTVWIGGFLPTWCGLWIAIWDVLLAVGAHYRLPALLIVWQIFMMMYIVLYFLMWTVLPALLVAELALLSVGSTYTYSSNNYGGSSYSYNQPAVSVSTANVGPIIGLTVWGMIISIAMPIVYLYFWIVVNNLRREFSRPQPQPSQFANPPPPTTNFYPAVSTVNPKPTPNPSFYQPGPVLNSEPMYHHY